MTEYSAYVIDEETDLRGPWYSLPADAVPLDIVYPCGVFDLVPKRRFALCAQRKMIRIVRGKRSGRVRMAKSLYGAWRT